MQSTPPYFNISPDEALASLDDPMGTTEFRNIAESCFQGRADLISRGLNTQGKKELRLFSTWEITKYLIPVAAAHFRRVLRQNTDLPQGRSDTEGGAKWFTLEEVLLLRAHFDAEGSKQKEYLPYRPKGLPAKMVAVANFKGGVGKTSTATHLAMSAALDGYKVLVLDLDSQGSLTSVLGAQVADEWQTVFPLLARHYGQHLMAENRRRMDRGDDPRPVDDTLSEAMKLRSGDLIQSTHWPNIDIIGAQLNLYWLEFQMPVWRMSERGWRLWDALSDTLAEDGVLDDYDLIFIDTPPALGYLTINALAAADILLVPTGASFVEFDSTGRFFDMLYSTFQSIEESDTLVSRALGLEGMEFAWDAVKVVLTRFDSTQQAEMGALMQTYMGSTLSPHKQGFTALIGQAGEQVSGIYEADYRNFNRETYARGRATFDETYAGLKHLVLGAWRRDELELQAQTSESEE